MEKLIDSESEMKIVTEKKTEIIKKPEETNTYHSKHLD